MNALTRSTFAQASLALLSLCAAKYAAAQTVDGSDSADAIDVGANAISSDNTLTYDLGDGGGSQTGMTTPDYSSFASTPITLDGKEGDDTISLTGSPTVGVNIFGGLGNNTIKVPAGLYMLGNIQAGSVLPGSTDNSHIRIHGHVIGDVGYGDVFIAGTEGDSASLTGGIGTIDGEDRLAHDVTLSYAIVANSGGGTAIKANGRIIVTNSVVNGEVNNRFSLEEDGIEMEDASAATVYSNGPILIKNGGPGVIDNSTSTTQASVSIIQGGSGSVTSRGEIIVVQGGGSDFTNTQVIPDTDNPGVIITLAGGGNVYSDGRVTIGTGGMGAINAAEVLLGGGASSAAITGRNLLALDFVDKVTLLSGGTANDVSLGAGNDKFTIEDFTNVVANEVIDGGVGDADEFNIGSLLITDFAIFFNNAEVSMVQPSETVTASVDSTRFELYNITNTDVSEAIAEIYGEELSRIFYDPEFSSMLDNLLVYVDGELVSQSELEDVALSSDPETKTQFLFTGNNPISGEFYTFGFTSSVPEPSTYALLTGLLIGALAAWRRRR